MQTRIGEEYTATIDMLKVFHLHSDSTVFRVLSLDDELLIMKNEERTYTLRKW